MWAFPEASGHEAPGKIRLAKLSMQYEGRAHVLKRKNTVNDCNTGFGGPDKVFRSNRPTFNDIYRRPQDSVMEIPVYDNKVFLPRRVFSQTRTRETRKNR